MKTPPLLLFAALLFWGWQSDLLMAGVLAGVVLEATRVFKGRWDLDDADFHRIWSFCVLVVVALAGYIFTTNEEGGGLAGLLGQASVHNASVSSTLTTTTLLRWLPLTFFPFIVAQVYNARPSVPLTAVSLVLRWRRRRGNRAFTGRYLDISYPYFIVCVFSAGAHANQGTHTYFWGQCALILWALWVRRSRRFGLTAWVGALAGVIALGFLGQLGISQAGRMAQNIETQWLARFFRAKTDALQSVTSIGRIGNLKLSPRIVIRLEPQRVGMAPNYLREASYRNYGARNQTWSVGGSRTDFEEVLSGPNDPALWTLVAGKTNTQAVNISCYLNSWSQDLQAPEGLLPLPSGSSRLDKLPVVTLKKNKTGAVLAAGPGLVIFDANYGPGATLDSAPDNSTNQFDLLVPTNEIPALNQVIAEMKIHGTNDAEKRQAVQNFFSEKFTYDAWQGPDKRATTNATPLTRFLLNSRSGHCEYFATATVLLLRQLGIPARYAVGYAVHETSGSGYVVRERDAHAWCLAWNRQQQIWEDLDTTPASWLALEDRHSAFTDWLSDVKSWLGFQIAKFRWQQSHLRKYILWTLVPVLVVLLYHIIFRHRKKTRSTKKNAAAEAPVIWPGRDSGFYRLEKTLAARGRPRAPGELLSDWLDRALAEPALAALHAPLRELLQLHYRYRFDPSGLDDREKYLLAQKVDCVLSTLSQK